MKRSGRSIGQVGTVSETKVKVSKKEETGTIGGVIEVLKGDRVEFALSILHHSVWRNAGRSNDTGDSHRKTASKQ